MKYRFYAIVQLIILVFYIFRPVLPFVEYVLNKEFIVKNLCINRDKPHSCCEGKCYLEKQIKKNNDSNSDTKEKNTNKRVQNDEVKEFLSSHVNTPKVYETGLIFQTFAGTILIPSFIAAIFVPPKVSFAI